MSEQIRNIIADNNNFLIASGNTAPSEVFFAREALRFFLESLGKNVLVCPQLPGFISDKFASVLPARQNQKTSFKTEISVPKNVQIEEICYEEDEKNISVIISSKSKIASSDVLMREKLPKADVLFLLSYDPDIATLTNIAELPPRERQINIVKNQVPISKKVFDIARNFDENLSRKQELTTLLYAALVYETKNFRSGVSEEIFDFARMLLKSGAAKEKIAEAAESLKDISFSNVLGRALARTQIDQSTSSSWTFIAKNDFEKSGAPQDEFSRAALLEVLRENIPQVKTSFLFFEEPSGGARCLAYSVDTAISDKFSRELKQASNPLYFYSDRFGNFTDAERHMHKLLKRQ